MSNTIAAETMVTRRVGLYLNPCTSRLKKRLAAAPISPLLHQNVQDNAMLVDRAPQIMQNTVT